MFNISVNFKDKKNLDHTLESSLDVKFLVEALFVIYQLSDIKDDIHVISQFPCLLGHTVACSIV